MGRLLARILFLGILIFMTGCEVQKSCSTCPARGKCEVKKENSNRKIDTRAARILKAMSDTLDRAASFRFQTREVWDRPLKSGQVTQVSCERQILISRPDKLLAGYTGDTGSRTTWYDGKTLTVLEKQQNRYAEVGVPETIEKMFDYVFKHYTLTVPLADLLFSKPYDVLIANVQSGRYAGKHRVGNWMCHHLMFRQESADWQIWIDAGGTPVPRKVLIVYRNTPGQPEFSATLDHWDFSPERSPGQFEAKLPAGARRVDMKELIQGE